MKKRLLFVIALIIAGSITYLELHKDSRKKSVTNIAQRDVVKKKKKTEQERMLFVQERIEHELNMQRNPVTGEIPLQEKKNEFANAIIAKQKAITGRTTGSTYVTRGPSNLGGRTRAFAIDMTDGTSQTIIAGGVSSGLFRTTDGGTSWTKVSPNDEIHNVTAVAQDPRSGHQNTWYYATGEGIGNSASLGSFFFGQGVWKSTDGGITWNQIPQTNSNFTSFDTRLDIISALAVSPINGDLLIGAVNRIYRYDGTNLSTELSGTGTTSTSVVTDVLFTSSGRAYAAIHGSQSEGGVWTSPTGNGSWTRIAQNTSPAGWNATGRIVLGLAPSNNNILYALFNNGQALQNGGTIEADLWRYDSSSNTWTDFSSKMPDEDNGNLVGNDPFAIQGGYDLVVSVKPNDENFVVIGGTNAYKIANINTDSEFLRIGGYNSNANYALYSRGGDTHHPDIHALVFDPNNADVLFSGTDGGVHKTTDVNAATVTWTNLNNNYQTYQYYHVAMDPDGSNAVIGGAQDNGTTIGGDALTAFGLTNNTDMETWFGGDGVAVGIAQRNAGSTYQFYYGTQRGNMRTNFPTCCRGIAPNGSSSQFVTYFYLDPDNTNALYYAGLSTLYSTTDAINITSSTWNNLGVLPTSQNIRTLSATRGTYNPSSSYLLIGGDRGGIFRLDDPQNATDLTSAVDITPSGATTANGTVVSGLAIHPTNPDIVLAVYANYGINNIFLTMNATSANPTWTNVEQNLSAHSIRSAAITVVGSEVIYFVGTARGLYSSNDPSSKDWDIEGANTIGLAVVSGLVYRPSDDKLLVGTHGNGMFETTVEATLSNDAVTLGELGIKMYPNPAKVELNFASELIEINNNVRYNISDLTGKTVLRGNITNSKVNVSPLKRGVYIINVISGNKKQTLKFIKD